MTIFYKLYKNLYVNITNACSCDCIFCLRNSGDSVGEAVSLRLSREPDFEDIKTAFDKLDFNYKQIDEIVFCGYGEPMERADLVIETAKFLASRCNNPLRLNTNGLVKLIEPSFDMKGLKIFKGVSISLNAPDESEYMRVTRPRFGEGSFKAMLDFAREAKNYTNVNFTAVDVISEENIQKCKKLADTMDIPLRIRQYVKNNGTYD